MEAKALYDFEATQADEMSFKKGNIVCVTSTEDGGWYKAVMGPRSGFIPALYIKLEKNDWYHTMTRAEAEKHLLKVNSLGSYIYQDGEFLIRKSDKEFALSVKHEDTVQHFKILMDGNNKFYIWPNNVFDSIQKLVENYHNDNVSGDQRKTIVLKNVKEELYEALYDFTPANEEEIPLKKGDIIQLISKSDDNWWEGKARGRTGFFPKIYVKECSNSN